MSKASVGECLRRWGLFLVPSETVPPAELAAVKKRLHCESARQSPNRSNRRSRFARVVVELEILCLHSLVRRGKRRLAASIAYGRRRLVEKALGGGPGALSEPEKKQLLNDVTSLRILHERVWALPDGKRARHWGL
jgi:membrane glycosyltransferase